MISSPLVFRFVTVVLLLVFLLTGSLAASGLCFVLESVGSERAGNDEECTCKMSAAPDERAESIHWAPAMAPTASASMEIAAVDLRPGNAAHPLSFDAITPTPPPKA